VNRKTGKHASINGHQNLINRLSAMDLHSVGRGGGITTLLLPRSVADQRKMDKIISTYKVKSVVTRSNRERNNTCDAVMDDALMANLAILFEQECGHKPKCIGAPVREFSLWVTEQLTDNRSKVSKLTETRYPELPNRKASWWKRQISKRLKRIKSIR